MVESKNCSRSWNFLLGSLTILIGIGQIVTSIATFLNIEINFEDNIHWGGAILVLSALTIFTGFCLIIASIRKSRCLYVFAEAQSITITIFYMGLGLALLYMKNNFRDVQMKISNTFRVGDKDLYYVDKMAFTAFGIGALLAASMISNFFDAHKNWDFEQENEVVQPKKLDTKKTLEECDVKLEERV